MLEQVAFCVNDLDFKGLVTEFVRQKYTCLKSLRFVRPFHKCRN